MSVVRCGRPGLTTIGRPQQSSAFTDHPAFFVVAKVDVIKRACGSGVLFDPCLAGVNGGQDRATRSDNPSSFVIHKIDVNELETAGSLLPSPAFAAVICINENAVNYSFAFAYRANHPAFFLARETNAVKVDISAIKLSRLKDAHFAPTRSFVMRDIDPISGQKKSRFFV